MGYSAPPARPDVPASRLRSKVRLGIGWVISIACIAFIFYKVDLNGVLRALEQFRWSLIGLALLCLIFGYSMRIARWTVMLRATGNAVRFRQCAAPFLGSIALNNVLPLRVGDIVRATVFPAAIGVPRSAAIGSIVMERLVDLLTLLCCLAVGATALQSAQLPRWLTDGAIVLAGVAIGTLFAIFLFSPTLERWLTTAARSDRASPLVARVVHECASLLASFRRMSSGRTLAVVFLLSFFAWFGEAGVFWSLIWGFGLGGGLLDGLMVMAFVTLSTLVPSSPGYVGPFHLAAFAAITLIGGGDETATSFAVLSHLMLWVPTTLAGGLAMLLRPQLFRGALAERQPLPS